MRVRSFRFVHIGVAVALGTACVVSVGIVSRVGAGGGAASSFVPIVPCRLADTRSGSDQVGTRLTPIGPGEIVPFTVWGTNGNCTIPTSATGIATNITAVNPTAASYLTVYPADAPAKPTASNLNWVPTSPPTPNQVTVALSSTGVIDVFNNGGTVDVIVDIVGYYEPAPAGGGAPGPQGPVGPQGVAGPTGPSAFISFAHINRSGVIVAPTRNVVFAINPSGSPGPGTYCLSFLGNITAYLPIVTLSLDFDDTDVGTKSAWAEVLHSAFGCAQAGYSTSTTIQVQTGYTNPSGSVLAPEGFFIALIPPS
ncbi:MAG: hypothetical protein JWN39_4150 [Ilumatobacteraceae bacterium]|nr:hypothetical protein [Ilumatobacteraceae bacterium]